MFGFFCIDDESRELNRKLVGLLNSVHHTVKRRGEHRAGVGIPFAIFRYSEARDPQHYAVGISSELSPRRLALFSPDALPVGDYIVLIGSGKHRVLVKATRERCMRACFGFYAIGFELRKLLRETDFPAIAGAAANLDRPKEPIPGRTA